MSKMIHLDFLVIGTQKAGTTSLHDWLMQHADVSLPKLKETHFFAYEYRFKNGIEWYRDQFSVARTASPLVGEIDPDYLFSEEAPERIKRLTDVNKFIVILRCPLQRAYSHYLMAVRRGFEELPFEEAIVTEERALTTGAGIFNLEYQSYISRSMYSGQIERYVRTFPDAKFLFIKFEDFISKKNGEEVYRRVCRFVGTKYDPLSVDRTKTSNQAAIPRFVWLRNVMSRKGRKSLLRKAVASLMSDQAKLTLFVFLDRLNQQKLVKSEIKSVSDFKIDGEIVRNLIADIEKTQAITALDLSEWKTELQLHLEKLRVQV